MTPIWLTAKLTTDFDRLKHLSIHPDFIVRFNVLQNKLSTEEIYLLVKARNKIDLYEIPYVLN